MKEKTVTAQPSLLDFLRLLKSHKLIIFMAVLLSLFSSVASIVQPVIVSKIVDSFTRIIIEDKNFMLETSFRSI